MAATRNPPWLLRKKPANSLNSIEHASEQIERLEIDEKQGMADLSVKAIELSRIRKQAAENLSMAVEQQLQELHMPGARFAVDFNTQPDRDGLADETGNQYALTTPALTRWSSSSPPIRARD